MLDRERDRPLGGLREESNRTLAPVSDGLHAAGDDLLRKAARAVASGEEDRAYRYIQRALDLPFDEHERIVPAWLSASMLIFTTITDRLDTSPEDDDSWLTAAEQVLQRCDPAAVPALLGSLATIVGDRSLPQVQARRCRRLVGDASADAWDEHEPVERHERFCAIQSVVAAAIDYQRHVPPRQAELGRWYRP
jgi:hypothetical protein